MSCHRDSAAHVNLLCLAEVLWRTLAVTGRRVIGNLAVEKTNSVAKRQAGVVAEQ